jgi:hypothetical protein
VLAGAAALNRHRFFEELGFCGHSFGPVAVTEPEWVRKRRLLKAKSGNGPTMAMKPSNGRSIFRFDRYANTAQISHFSLF